MPKLALLSDIHYGPDNIAVKGSVALELLGQILKTLSQKEADLLIDLGDRLNDVDSETDKKHLSELAALFASIPYPKEHLLGNHDLPPVAWQEQTLAAPLTNRSLDIANWHLVFLNTFKPKSIEGALTNETLEWLETDLNATSLPTIIFSHQPLDGQPLIGNRFFEVDFAKHAHPKNHSRARRIMEDSGKVRLALNGHTHWNHHLEHNGIHYLTIQSMVGFKDAQATQPAAAYGLLTLESKEFTFEVFGQDPFKLSLRVKLVQDL